MTRPTLITIIALALAACDARTLSDFEDVECPAPAEADPVEDLEPAPVPEAPAVECDPEAWVRAHEFAALEYWTVAECYLVHEDFAHYQYEFEFITEQALRCGADPDDLAENEEMAINALGFICANRRFPG